MGYRRTERCAASPPPHRGPCPSRSVRPRSPTQASTASHPGTKKHHAAFQRYSSTWMKSRTSVTSTPCRSIAARISALHVHRPTSATAAPAWGLAAAPPERPPRSPARATARRWPTPVCCALEAWARLPRLFTPMTDSDVRTSCAVGRMISRNPYIPRSALSPSIFAPNLLICRR